MRSTALYPAFLVLLAGCATPPPAPFGLASTELTSVASRGKRRFTAGDVVAWAQLQDYLGEHPVLIVPGQADDKEVLGRLVMLQNASEVAAFVKEHRGIRLTRLTKVTQLRNALVVEVEAVSEDGAKVILMLLSDGTPQGEG
jgi:hypothetical protein